MKIHRGLAAMALVTFGYNSRCKTAGAAAPAGPFPLAHAPAAAVPTMRTNLICGAGPCTLPALTHYLPENARKRRRYFFRSNTAPTRRSGSELRPSRISSSCVRRRCAWPKGKPWPKCASRWGPDHVWSYDFLHERTEDDRTLVWNVFKGELRDELLNREVF